MVHRFEHLAGKKYPGINIKTNAWPVEFPTQAGGGGVTVESTGTEVEIKKWPPPLIQTVLRKIQDAAMMLRRDADMKKKIQETKQK